MARRKKNSAAAIAGAAVVGAVAGGVAGYTIAVPDIEVKLDEVEKLIKAGKDQEASNLLISALDDIDKLYTRLGGAPSELRKRMVKLNDRLSARHQLFVLQEARSNNPAPTHKLKAKLLR